MQTALSPGNQVLHYRLIRKIGEGGMGVVFEAEDVRLGRTVAIKLLQPSISENKDARLRFLREARAASALDHPNLCTIYTAEELQDGSLLLVMACYRGQTVAEIVATSGAVELARLRDVGRQTAAGLHAAHMAGIVHRDIKPGNIFVLNSGVVKILDFGLSHVADQVQLTAPHQVMGTLAYMPPEQLAGDSVDHRADIWALGAVLYEMAVGHPPFQQPTSSATMAAIAECRYVPLHKIRSDLPQSIFHAIERSLRRERTERHASAADLLRLLDHDGGIAVTPAPAANEIAPFAVTAEIPTFTSNGKAVTQALYVQTRDTAQSGHSMRERVLVSETEHAADLSIAVLPLRNLSSEAENEYFSDGLTEELISSLGTLSGLRVVSRTSAFSFKNTTLNIRSIGEALDVEVILEGSVRRSGNRVRVLTQLTQVRRGFTLWSSRFDREISDVFELQDELAASVVSALRNTLAPDLDHSDMPSRPPMQADAYEAYLKGRYHWNRKTPEDIQLAGRYFERALELDETSAAAFAGMANFYCLHGMFGGMPPREAWALARTFALRSIALDATHPEGHIGLASVLQFSDWNWEKAREHLVQAIEFQPQRGESYYIYIAYLIIQGRLNEALEQTRLALSFDPLSAPLLAAESLVRVYLGDYDTGILLARAALTTAPHYVELYYSLGMAQTLSGRPHEAVKTFESGIERSRTLFLLGWLAEAHAVSGNQGEARGILDRLLELAKNGNAMPISIAVAAAALGENDLALKWLETAADQRDILAVYAGILPSFIKLHEEPRYHQLLERMKLPRISSGRTHDAAR